MEKEQYLPFFDGCTADSRLTQADISCTTTARLFFFPLLGRHRMAFVTASISARVTFVLASFQAATFRVRGSPSARRRRSQLDAHDEHRDQRGGRAALRLPAGVRHRSEQPRPRGVGWNLFRAGMFSMQCWKWWKEAHLSQVFRTSFK